MNWWTTATTVAAMAIATSAPAADLTLKGLNGTTTTVSAANFASLPHESLTVTFHGEKRTFEGVSMLELLRKVGAPWGDTLTGKELATVVLVTARDGYRVAYSIGELDPGTARGKVLIADRADGKPLDGEDGPFQVVVEADFRPARSARMIERIELISLKPPS